jgi:putative nucleotidyltransferase with HDIG domain
VAAGLALAIAAFHFGPTDPRLERSLAAAVLGGSATFGLGLGFEAWIGFLRRPRVLPGVGVLAGVRALLATLASRDGETAVHCTRVARVADLIADHLGTLSPARRHALRTACLLHDIGKLWVPLAILRKPGALDEEEWLHMRAHAADGSILTRSALPGSSRVARIIHEHHERIDGRGYPRGLAGETILLESRIVAVADALDAMLCDRPYRRGLPLSVALAELLRSAGHGPDGEHQFDRGVVEALVRRTAEVERLYRRHLARRLEPLAVTG